MNTRANAICLKCGNIFTPLPDKVGKYCSQVCYQSVKNAPLAERFWRYVEKTSDCWKWTGKATVKGYGRIARGRSQGSEHPTNILAHRVSWIIHFGAVPENMNVLHHCDNPSCVRPDHLFLGSQMDNMIDCSEKGRRGNLTRDAVRDMRTAYRSGKTLRALAVEHAVSKSTAFNVIRGKTWRHVI